LKRLGKEAEFIEYDHEGHVLQIPINVIDFRERCLDWFDRLPKKKRLLIFGAALE